MDQASAAEQSEEVETGIWGLFTSLAVLMLLYGILGWFDNTTELRPDHDNIQQACFAVAGLGALVSGVVLIRKSKGISVWRRAVLALLFSFLGFLAVFLVSSRTADIVEGWIDFPRETTTSYSTLLSISRAYYAQGGRFSQQHWVIQTTPIWSILHITQHDYEFMVRHRRIGDNSRDHDRISSKGYFCAQVTMQQSGNALRVLHAGSQTLPEGTVIICPPTTGK